MGQLFDIIQDHIDRQPYQVSKRQVARRIGVSPTTIDNWREPTKLIDKRHLEAISAVTGVSYERVLHALLADIGYLHRGGPASGGADQAVAQ